LALNNKKKIKGKKNQLDVALFYLVSISTKLFCFGAIHEKYRYAFIKIKIR
jgi:hypothetical protein